MHPLCRDFLLEHAFSLSLSLSLSHSHTHTHTYELREVHTPRRDFLLENEFAENLHPSEPELSWDIN